ncbi:MAG: CvpA family protein [Candidatus Aminicenantes bacterium]|nr:CvpA family protein [Candidatus Aminicenantes bacterium]
MIGILRGFIKELLSIIFLILAVVLSILFYKEAGLIFNSFINNPEVANFTGFIAVFIGTLISGSLITFFLRKVIVIGPLKFIDRLLGALFGFVRSALICSIILFGILAFPGDKKQIVSDSQFAPEVYKVIKVIMGYIPDNFKKSVSV